MSQQELEQTDQEVMEMVNKSATAGAKRRAEEIADAIKEPSPEELADKEAERLHKEYCHKRKIRAVLCVAACILIAVALLIVLFAPALLVWVVNIGILCCGVVAGMTVDRLQRWRL